MNQSALLLSTSLAQFTLSEANVHSFTFGNSYPHVSRSVRNEATAQRPLREFYLSYQGTKTRRDLKLCFVKLCALVS